MILLLRKTIFIFNATRTATVRKRNAVLPIVIACHQNAKSQRTMTEEVSVFGACLLQREFKVSIILWMYVLIQIAVDRVSLEKKVRDKKQNILLLFS